MTFEELKTFLTKQMRMSHIYQPLLIKNLLESGGLATVRQLAVSFAAQDESQVVFYEKRLKEMPIKVLSSHGIIEKQGELVTLKIGKLSLQQRAELEQICYEKIQKYIAAKGLAVWDYRLLDDNPIPDSLRYRVLAEGKGRCALCGATRDETVLDVDHIIPRNKGGKTVYENLQVLCAKCNRSKQDQDDTDFRKLLAVASEGCVFCTDTKHELENKLAFVIESPKPVVEGHSLVVPKRHCGDYFEMTEQEIRAVNELLRIRRKELLEKDRGIRGFEVSTGKNLDYSGHCRVHFVPRRDILVKE